MDQRHRLGFEQYAEDVKPVTLGQYLTDIGKGGVALGETALSLGSGILGEITSGYGGLYGLTSGAGPDVSANAVRNIQEGMTYQPRTEQGQNMMGAVGQMLAPVGQGFEAVGKTYGDQVFDMTGSPAAAAATSAVAQSLPDLLGLGVARRLAPSGPSITGSPAAPMQSQRGAIMLTPEGRNLRDENVRGPAGYTSKLQNAILDIIENRQQNNLPENATDSVTKSYLRKQLAGRNITEEEMRMSGLDPKTLTGNDTIRLTSLLDVIAPPNRDIDVTVQERGQGGLDESDFENEVLNSEGFLPRESHGDELYEWTDSLTWDDDARGGLSDAYVAVRSDDIDYYEAQKEFDELFEGAVDVDDGLTKLRNRIRGDNPEAVASFDDRLEDMAQQRADEIYDDEPYMQYNPTIRVGNEQFDVNIIGNDSAGYTVTIDGRSTNDVHYSLSEAMIDARNSIDYDSYNTGGVNWNNPEYFRGEVDHNTVENVIITKDDLDYENSVHFSGIEGNLAHLRTSLRQTADGEDVYYVDEMQSDIHSDARKAGGYRDDSILGNLLDADDRARTKLDMSRQELIQNIKNTQATLAPDQFDRLLDRQNGATEEINDGHMVALQRKLEGLINEKELFNEISDEIDMTPVEYAKQVVSVRLGGDVPDSINKMIEQIDGEQALRRKAADAREKRKNEQMKPPEAPMQDDKWIGMTASQAIMGAIEANKSGVVFSNAENQVNVWGDRYREGYKTVYDEKLPAALKRIGRKYGVEPRKIKMDDPDLQEDGLNWYLPITPKMREEIMDKGMDLYTKRQQGTDGGILDMIGGSATSVA